MPKVQDPSFFSIEAGLPVAVKLSFYLTSPKNTIYLLVEMIILILATNTDLIKHRCVNVAIFVLVQGSAIYSHLGAPCIHNEPWALAPRSAKPRKLFCSDFSFSKGNVDVAFI